MSDRPLPHSLEAERAVLGASLAHPDACEDAVELVRPDHFFRRAHQIAFRAVVGLHESGVRVDLLTLKDALLKSGELEDVGGPAYLAGLTDGVPRSTNVRDYARIVVEKSQLRSVIQTATALLQDAYKAEDSPRDVVATAERSLAELSTTVTQGAFVRLGEVIPSLLDRFEAWQKAGTGITGLATGFTDLDRMTGGLQPGQLVIIAARPSMGKSALVQNIGANVAKRGETVGMFSLEMERDELAQRAVFSEADINGHAVRRGRLDQASWGRLAAAMGTLDQIPFFVDDTPSVRVLDVRGKARRLKAEHGLSLLIVDYAQLMDGDDSETRALQLAQITRGLKKTAKELRVPIIALSQLSRELEKRPDKRPTLADLRESGAIEQDADLVLFIYRPVVYSLTPGQQFQGMSADEYETLAEIILAKQRNGPTGTIELNWFKESTTFANRVSTAQPSMAGQW